MNNCGINSFFNWHKFSWQHYPVLYTIADKSYKISIERFKKNAWLLARHKEGE